MQKTSPSPERYPKSENNINVPLSSDGHGSLNREDPSCVLISVSCRAIIVCPVLGLMGPPRNIA